MTRLETAAHKRIAVQLTTEMISMLLLEDCQEFLALGARTTSHVPLQFSLLAVCLREGLLAFEASNFGPAAGVAQRRGY